MIIINVIYLRNNKYKNLLHNIIKHIQIRYIPAITVKVNINIVKRMKNILKYVLYYKQINNKLIKKRRINALIVINNTHQKNHTTNTF